MAGLLHPLLHHVAHFVVRQLLFPLQDVSEHGRIRLLINLFGIFFLLFQSSGNFLLLPFIAHICVDVPELGNFILVLDKLVVLHFVRSVVQLEEELKEFAVAMFWVLRLRQRVHHVPSHFSDCSFFTICVLSLLRSLFLNALLLNLLSLLEKLGRWLEHWSTHWASHHAHLVHPGLAELRLTLSSLCLCRIGLDWSRLRVPHGIEVNWLLCHLLEDILLLLGCAHCVDLHPIELLLHHLLSLHVRELLFHHLHGSGVLSLGWVLVALGCLAGPRIAHNHTLHHVGERVGTEAVSLLAIGLTGAPGHCFVKHLPFEISLKFYF